MTKNNTLDSKEKNSNIYSNKSNTYSKNKNKKTGSNKKNYVENKLPYKDIIYTTKVNKTTKGGRNTSFFVISVVGDYKSIVGIGVGKSRSIPSAIDKSLQDAQSNTIRPSNITNMKYKLGSSKIIIATNKSNLLRAPSYIASIFEAFGQRGVSCKVIGTKNQMNVIFSLFKALKEMIFMQKIRLNRIDYVNETISQKNN